MSSKLPLFLSICLLLLAGRVQSQDSKDLGSYESINLKIPFSSKWSIYGNAEMRSSGLLTRFYHLETKVGLSYKYNEAVSFTLAGGLYQNYRSGPDFDNVSEVKEFRIWEQVVLKHKLLFANFQHRVRIEETVNDHLKLTFRYRPELSIPLNSKAVKPGTIFLAVNDEIFLRAEKPVFYKNRFYAGLGYQLSAIVGLKTGILRQVDYKIQEEDRGKNFFYLQVDLKL